MKKSIIVVGIVILLVFVFFQNKEDDKIIIASCPTFYHILDDFGDNVDSFKTESTSESISLIRSGKVDAIVTGRPFKEGEPILDCIKIGHGYDFVSQNELVITAEEMKDYSFYTNLELESIINDFENITADNLFKVDNISDFLDRGIVVTALDNVLIGETVHILTRHGNRVDLSRLPRICFLDGFIENRIEGLIE